MNALVVTIICFSFYAIAYKKYGRFLAKNIFNISKNAPVPSIQNNDQSEYVPTPLPVVFGHHFTSIAGTGPIVGPAIGVIWGWGPALLWILFGSIFLGAVQDFSALIISIRHNGKTLTQITKDIISPKVQRLFFIIVFLALLIVIAIFGLIIALIFAQFPHAVLPIWSEIPIAMMLGWWLYSRKKNSKVALWIAKLAFITTLYLGYQCPLHLDSLFGIPATGLWTLILLTYAFFASILPITRLMQPRDYLNAWQLYGILILICVGIVTAALTTPFTMTAPFYQAAPEGTPHLWPFLFIIISCGAISGFHAMVSSGTTSKQLSCETHSQSVGYGSMILEACLATLIIITVTAGLSMGYQAENEFLTGLTAWKTHYTSWHESSGLSNKLNAVVIGTSNILATLGIPTKLSIVIMGVFIASFAATTLDSATRIQRYTITELAKKTKIEPYMNKITATTIAILSAAILAFSSGTNGKGALLLWPLMGAVNQLLATIALMIATLYLQKKGSHKWIFTGIPFIIMSTITLWASLENEYHFILEKQYLLATIGGIIIYLGITIIKEGCYKWKENRQ